MKSRFFKAALGSTLFFSQTLFAFNPLAQDEMPKGTFSVPFATKMETDPAKIHQLAAQGVNFQNPILFVSSIVELSTDTRDIDITFYPKGKFPSFVIPVGFPIDAASHIHEMMGLEKSPTTDTRGFGYMNENVFMQPNPKHVIGQREYWMDLSPDQFMTSFKAHLHQVEQAGIKAVSLKNPEIMKTIDIIFHGSSKQRKRINQNQFKEVFNLLSYVFAGKVTEVPVGLEDSMLKPDISLTPGRKPQFRVKNSRTLKAWLEKVGLGLSEDKTYLRMVPKPNV